MLPRIAADGDGDFEGADFAGDAIEGRAERREWGCSGLPGQVWDGG